MPPVLLTPEFVPEIQPTKQNHSKFDPKKCVKARSLAGFSLARFFAASPDNAKKVLLLADAIHNFEGNTEMAEKITNSSSDFNMKVDEPFRVYTRNDLMAVKTVARWHRETPEVWKTISAPVRIQVKVSRPEWHTQSKKSMISEVRCLSGVGGKIQSAIPIQDLDINTARSTDPRFLCLENPFKALQGIGKDDFQVPWTRIHRRKIFKSHTLRSRTASLMLVRW